MANMMIERSSGLKDMLPLPKNADSAVLFVSLVSYLPYVLQKWSWIKAMSSISRQIPLGWKHI